MKRFLITIVLIIAALPLSAGMTYKFNTVVTGQGASKMSGNVAVEGTNMRIEFTSGDKMIFKDNSVVISRDGGKTLLVLDPKEKTYFEFSLQELFSMTGNMMKSMGGMFQMSIDNQKVTVTETGAGEPIEGYPTRKYVMSSTYDMNMKVMGMKSSSKVETTTESWTTDKIGREFMTFVQDKGLKTGMEELDKMIAAQSAPMKGFPLKQISTMKSTSGKKTQTTTTSTTVTALAKASVPASAFEIPSGYTEGESPLAVPAGLMQPRE